MVTPIMWIAAFLVFLVLEGATYQIVSIWFAVGSLGALAANLMGLGTVGQMTVFALLAIVLLVLLRPISLKMLKNGPTKTNADALVGQKVLITETVDNIMGKGKGKVNGMEWTVRSDDGSNIESGKNVTIKKIEGVKLIVENKED